MVKSLLCKHEPRSENACGKTEILLFGLKLGEYLENRAALSPVRFLRSTPRGSNPFQQALEPHRKNRDKTVSFYSYFSFQSQKVESTREGRA